MLPKDNKEEETRRADSTFYSEISPTTLKFLTSYPYLYSASLRIEPNEMVETVVPQSWDILGDQKVPAMLVLYLLSEIRI